MTVICRMPSGLVLDLYDEDALRAPPHPGALPAIKDSVRLKGAKHDGRYHRKENIMLGMGGRTEVAADFWEAWTKQNAEFMPLKKGLIFAMPKKDDAVSRLSELREERTGLEGLNKDKMPGITPFAREDD